MATSDEHSIDAGPQTIDSPEFRENEEPKPGMPCPKLSTEEFIRIKQWQIDRALYFLFFMSLGCAGAIVLAPKHVVEVLIGTIWITSIGLARRLIGGAYHQKHDRRA